MARHIVSYEENHDGSKSRAKCSCGTVGPWQNGGAERTWNALDKWAEAHIDEAS